MDEVYIAIEEVKKLIRKNIIHDSILEKPSDFEGYQNIYYQTNENITDYLNLIDISQKENALCVAGSGDQAFSLIYKGINKIDLFDINKLTEYYILGLKKAMLLKYNYDEYINTLNKFINQMTMPIEINEIIFDLLSYMEEPYKYFWQNILEYNQKLQKELNINTNFMYNLNINAGLKTNLSFCPFLISEDNYNKLKSNLNMANLNFKYCNAINLTDKFKRKYDLILLSNVLDYAYIYWGNNWEIQNLNNYITNLQKITNNDGIIFLHYIFYSSKPFHLSNFYNPYLTYSSNIYNLKNNHQILLVRNKKGRILK